MLYKGQQDAITAFLGTTKVQAAGICSVSVQSVKCVSLKVGLFEAYGAAGKRYGDFCEKCQRLN